jgi:hypothetical protein
MVEVFKTNVQRTEQARKIIGQLKIHFPNSRINFDLDDCDKVLRIDSKRLLSSAEVIRALNESGFFCEMLD